MGKKCQEKYKNRLDRVRNLRYNEINLYDMLHPTTVIGGNLDGNHAGQKNQSDGSGIFAAEKKPADGRMDRRNKNSQRKHPLQGVFRQPCGGAGSAPDAPGGETDRDAAWYGNLRGKSR